MRRLILILGDQLSREYLFDILGFDAAHDHVLMIESDDFVARRPYHKKKIVLLWAAMRHFAEELREEDVPLTYIRQDEQRRFRESIVRVFREGDFGQMVFVQPRERATRLGLHKFLSAENIPFAESPDPFWYTQPDDFAVWLDTHPHPKMEDYYRQKRRETGILMSGAKPVGGTWNYDKENRKPFPKKHAAPDRFFVLPDPTTQEVMQIVDALPGLYGGVENFAFPVSRDEAVSLLHHFVENLLPQFGAYEDAMSSGDPYGYHSLLSLLMNISLLSPQEILQAVLAAYEAGNAPLNSVEGFIRQILGWREFMYHMFESFPGDYNTVNTLGHTRALPAWFWTGDTHMNCLRHVIQQVLANGYSHHIERLMVIGNFNLLYGGDPHALNEWFWALYLDAYEWVVTPNVVGMSQFADGGWIATKPYISSGAYINRMSDYCDGCRYNPKEAVGDDACPFTTLYWAFLIEHKDEPLSARMAQNYFGLRTKSDEEQGKILEKKTLLLQMVESL